MKDLRPVTTAITEKEYEHLSRSSADPRSIGGYDHLKGNEVVHPSHYTFGKYEVIDVINDWRLAFNLGNAVKYIARAGKKDKDKHIQDLEKAKFYLEYEIAKLKQEISRG